MNIIRKFQPSDFRQVINIERRVFNEHDPFFYMQFYETCSNGFIVAQVDGLIVGYVVGFLASEKVGRIFSIAVLPEYRDLSIGSALLEEVVRVLREMGAAEVMLEVRMGNLKARRFYERHGFHKTGIIERYYNDGEDALLMKLKINPR